MNINKKVIGESIAVLAEASVGLLAAYGAEIITANVLNTFMPGNGLSKFGKAAVFTAKVVITSGAGGAAVKLTHETVDAVKILSIEGKKILKDVKEVNNEKVEEVGA